MNSQMRTNLFFAILLGTLGSVLFWLFNLSIEIWFTSPYEKNDYLGSLLPVGLAFFTSGSLISINSVNHKFWKLGLILLLLLNLITIALGLSFTFNIRAEEFLPYFLAIIITWLVYLAILGIYIRYLLQSSLNAKQKNLVIIGGILSLFGINSLLAIATQLIYFEVFYALILTAAVLVFMLVLSLKSDTSSQEEFSEPLNFKKLGVNTNLRTVILSIAILISIFLVVYANIQAEQARKQEYMMREMFEESQLHQKAAENEIVDLTNELAGCESTRN